MRNLIFFVIIFSMITSCNTKNEKINFHKESKHSCKELIKVDITDKYLVKALDEYSKQFDFKGKGVLFVVIKSVNDTAKYFVGTIHDQESFNVIFDAKPYLFYDTINRHVVILYSNIEPYFKPKSCDMNCDSILLKYFNKVQSIREINYYEYLRVDSTMTRKIVRYNPFF